MALSPSNTWIVTAGWLSEKVVKICCCFVGIVVFLLIREDITPPAVSMPRERGATSRRRRSETASEVSPTRMAACTAAPYATASNPGGATDKDNVVDGGFVKLGIPHCLLHWIEGALEKVRAELLESSSGDGRVEVDAIKEGVDLNAGLCGGREGSLGSLTGSPQPPEGSLVSSEVLLVLPLELLDKVIHHPVIKVLPAQMSVSCC